MISLNLVDGSSITLIENPIGDLRVRGSMGKGVYRELLFSFKRSRLRCLWNKYSNGDFQ